MANDKGKPKATNGNDVLVGTAKNDNISGKKGDDQISGLAGSDKLKGDQGNDLLDGGSGNDRLYGGKGDDRILGGSGNDVLYGDGGKSHGWGWDKYCWWTPKSDDDDYLDGGAGSDRIYAGRGNDVAVYSMAGNLGAGFKNVGAHDEYDGGTGHDTLLLQLTYGEAELRSVKEDIAAFRKFLDYKADARSDHGKEFEFKSFNLDVANFEALQIQLVNTGPTARADSGATSEDAVRVVTGPGLLGNDSDADHLDVLSVIAGSTTSAKGAVVVLGANGGYSYDPRGALELQKLAQGQTATDTFSYSITDLGGAIATATVSITVTGVNDAPVGEDVVIGGGGGGGGGEAAASQGDPFLISAALLLAGATDAEGDALFISEVSPVSELGATVSLDAEGNIVYDPTEGLKYLAEGEVVTDSFTYTVSDGDDALGAFASRGSFASFSLLSEVQVAGSTATVFLTVKGVNDAPDTADDARSTSEDALITGNVLANDSDPERDSLTVTTTGSFTTAKGAALILAADGTYSYDPTDSATLQALASGASTVDSFSYAVRDSHGATSTATVDITVTGEDAAAGASNKLLPSVSDANLDYFIRFEDGEWLRTDSFSLGLSQTGSLGSGGGGGAGKATPTDVHTLLGSSQTLTQLTKSLATGEHLKSVEIEVYSAGEKPQLLEEYVFNDVLLTSLQTSGHSSSTASSLSFDYTKFDHAYVDYEEDGSKGATTHDGFDFKKNEDADGSGAPAAEAFKAKLDDAVPTDADLNYYVTWDGAGGWLDLNSFSMALSQTGSFGTGGGGGAGKVSASPVSLSLGASAQLLQLTDKLATGAHIKYLEVEAYSVGEKPQLVDQYVFEDVLVSSWQGSNTVANSVSVDYSKFSHGHVDYKEDGSKEGTTSVGFDFKKNESFDGASVDADFKDTRLPSVSDANLDYFIRFEDGEWLRTDSFSLGLSQTGSLGSGGGGGAGKATPTDVHTLLGSSQTLTQLTKSLATGEHLKSVEIEVYSAGEKPQLLEEYVFNDVLLTSLQTSGHSSSTANSLSFDYTKFDHAYVDYEEDGSKGATTHDGFDFKKNEDADGSGAPAAEAFKAKLDDAVPTDADLNYYVTWDGAGGWLDLNSFSMALSQTGSFGTGGGGGAGKVSASPVSLSLGASAQLLQLTDKLATGAHIKYLEVEAYSVGEKPQLVDQYVFEDVLVSNWQGSNTVANSVSVDYSKFSHGHVDYKEDGSKEGTTSVGFDFKANKSTSGAPVDADLFTAANTAPVAGNDSASTNEDTAISGNLLGNDTDADDDALSTLAGTFTSAKGASVTIGADGAYSYNPAVSATLQALATGASTVDTFSYTLSDGHGGTDIGTVSVSVAGLNEPASGGSPGEILSSVAPGTTLEYYIRFEDDSPEWMRLESFNWGVSNPVDLGSATGGAGAGKAIAQPVSLVLGSSQTATQLAQYLAAGKHLESVEIEAYAPGGDKGAQLVDQYYFETVFLSKLETSAASGSAPQESVSFAYAKFDHGHVTQDETGALSSTQDGWDFVKNLDDNGFGPAVTGDALKAKLDETVGGALKYYVTFDGAPGWLELSSFSTGLTNPVSIGSATGGAGAGKVSASPAMLGLGSSKELLTLTDALTEGRHFKFLEVEAYASGGDKGAQLVDQYYFETVFVSSLNGAGANDNLVGVEFGKFIHEHAQQDETGAIGPSTKAGWDLIENRAFTSPTHAVGDLGKDLPLESVGPQAQLEYYIRFEDDSPEWMRLESFNWGVSNPVDLGSATGGAGVGKAIAQPVSLVLGSSQTATQLAQYLAAGKHLESVEIEAYAPGGDKGAQLVDQYYFETVFLSKLETSAASGSAPQESVSFAYAKFDHGHVTQDDKGALSSTQDGWDFVKNLDDNGFGPAVTGDALKAKLDETVGGALKYYVTFDGAPGWLELSSFSTGLTNPVSIGSATGGAGAGKVSASPAMLGLGSSKELLTLSDALTEGRHFKFLEVEAYASGGDKGAQLVDQYYFETVFVSSLNGAGANDNLVGVEFGKFIHEHAQQDETGAIGPSTKAGWDLIENRAFTSPTHAVGDLGKDLPLESVGPQAQLEYYIRFEDDSPEWMRLESFNWGVSNPVDLGSATGGAGAGKAIAQPVSLVLGSSQTATQLAQYLAAGKHLESVEIEAYAPGGDKGAQLVDQYYFETVFLSKLETSAASGSAPQESVSFAYAKFDHGHVTQDEKGALSSTQDGWDFVKNLDDNGFGPAVTGDALKAKLDETVGGALKYYVTFDGAPGWLELSSFSTGLTNPVSIGSATGGAGAGKVSASPAMLGLGSSKELLTLSDALTEGRHFKFLEVEAYASGGDKGAQLVDQYYFETVFVSSLNGAGANDNLVGVDFGKFAHGHIEQTDEGALGQLTEVGWDFIENKLFTAPTDSDLF